MTQLILLAAALAGFSGVGLGAVGAHAFAALLAQNNRADTYQTAVLYHLVHALALLAVAILSRQAPAPSLNVAAAAFVAGIFLFSGSLYVLALGNVRVMGAIAPLGGIAFLVGWAALGYSALTSSG
jgi:uncharacterized membrane protein YgdD (TMEM256/DUF423 family)